MKTNNKPAIQLALAALFLIVLLASFQTQAQFWKKQTDSLLPETEAFIEAAAIDGSTLKIVWEIADDYYMYRDQFRIVPITPGLVLGNATYPQGVVENDPEFGEVVVYFNRIEYTAPITRFPNSGETLELELKGQGCNKPVGVCYAPQTRLVELNYTRPATSALNDVSNSASNDGSSDSLNATDNTNTQVDVPISSANTPPANQANEKSFWGYVITAFGAGILLSFTPCVLPMIPILAGIIAGQKNPTKLQSGWLAICYVIGTVVTYAIAGWVAGASGTQLQAHFQNPWVIGLICAFLMVLATSLFGAFKIQLPSSVQTKLSTASVNSRSASFSSFGLGLISALVVGACVSPILILTLGAAITKGDPVLGAAIMSAMALGMGSLLILFGFGAGWLLPRTGAWMNHIQVLFGFMVLGVAIYIASALPAVPTLYLWAALLFWAGSYLLRFASELTFDLVASLLRGAGFASLLWGGMALIGATTGGNEILNPLGSVQLSGGGTSAQKTKLPFDVVTTEKDAKELLGKARASGKPVLVDFYADWCLDCVRMDKTTFLEPTVHNALTDWALIKVDVTQTNADSEAVKQYFDVFGPPATLFFKADGTEHQNLRQYGYLKESDFLTIVDRASR